MTNRRCFFLIFAVAVMAAVVKPPEFPVDSTSVLSAAQSPKAPITAPKSIRQVKHPYDPDWPDVWLIVAQKCNGCHRPHTKRTDFSSWQRLVDCEVNGELLIVPGDPENSEFWDQIVWNHRQDPNSVEMAVPLMPPKKEDWLTAGQLATIERWIKNGALKYQLPETCSTRPLLEIDFPSAQECQACPPKQFAEWSRSMHAYAQHSPIFEAFNLTLQ